MTMKKMNTLELTPTSSDFDTVNNDAEEKTKMTKLMHLIEVKMLNHPIKTLIYPIKMTMLLHPMKVKRSMHPTIDMLNNNVDNDNVDTYLVIHLLVIQICFNNLQDQQSVIINLYHIIPGLPSFS